ncbi:unnamed protein product [Toxocara canis]|uniref:VASt domain-containing protein n=1 Tax=Toxocara canis TaxID=6265 RepID=A0A183V826_TOXCA|nr:unnamed protein product [Toxocara canis]
MKRAGFRRYYEIFEQQQKHQAKETTNQIVDQVSPTEAIQADVMEYVEKKIDTLLRRVSSKSRRAARRARRVASDSSSGSEFDDCSASLTPRCDRKTLGSRRSLHKLPSYSKLNSLPSTEKLREENLLTKLGIRKDRVSYFSIWFAVSLCHLQKALLALVRMERQQKNSSSSESQNTEPTSRSIADHRHKTNCSKPIEVFKLYSTDAQSSRSGQDKSCESEDADYVSDYSLYSRPRKSINELDMSIDESLADLSGRESGYLSGIDLSFINRGSPSSGDSPALSPRGFSFGRERAHLVGRPLKLKSSFAERILSDTVVETQIQGSESMLRIGRPLQVVRKTQQEDDTMVPDYKSTELMLKSSISETKYVTAIFEVTSGGIVGIIEDVLNEFNMWFNAHIGLMGIACEVHWSCPGRYRNRAVETRMKEALHCSLRENNRRLLNLKNNTGMRLPLTLVAATTEENCQTNSQLDCFQGVYRRFYESLLAFQHPETGEWHKPYWNIEKAGKHHKAPEPNPQQFISGSQPTQLDKGSLVAVNIVALRISF